MKCVGVFLLLVAVGIVARGYHASQSPVLATGNDRHNEQDELPVATFTPSAKSSGDTPDHLTWVGGNSYRRDNGEIVTFPGMDNGRPAYR